MKKVLKTLAFVAIFAGFASCGSNPAAEVTGGQTSYLPPGEVIIDGK